MTRKKAGNSNIAVGYIRVSTDDQNLGPAAQRAQLESWCKSNGAVLAAVMEDHGVSGGTCLDKRPGLLLALASLPEHGAGVLLVAKRDRLARDPMVAAMVEAGAKRHGARIISAAGEGTGADDPTAVLMRRIVDAFSEYERLVIRARTSAALQVKKSRGEKTGGDTPYGYQMAPDGVHIEPHEGEQKAIHLIRELRDSGLSLRAIANHLNDQGITPRGNRWHPTSVVRILDRVAA
jgi:site-specific DNA recombinase